MRPFLPLALLVATLGGATARARDCAGATSQTDLNLCAGQAFSRADARLNTAYRAYAVRLTPGSRDRLRAAQRAWIAFRDAECVFRASAVEGGSAQPMVAAQCKAAVTLERARQVEALAACPEGDLACPR